jgi:hypothetical protein
MILFDNIPPKLTIQKIYNFDKLTKFKLFISSFPISITYSIIYLYIDPVLIQLINGTTIIFNLSLSIIINKKYYLIEWKIIILSIINIIGCIIPYIINFNTHNFFLYLFNIYIKMFNYKKYLKYKIKYLNKKNIRSLLNE